MLQFSFVPRTPIMICLSVQLRLRAESMFYPFLFMCFCSAMNPIRLFVMFTIPIPTHFLTRDQNLFSFMSPIEYKVIVLHYHVENKITAS